MQSLRALPRHPRSASARAALMVVGTLCAAAGLFWGKVALRVNPIDTRTNDLDLLIRTSFSSPAGPSNPPTLPALAERGAVVVVNVESPVQHRRRKARHVHAYVHLATDSLIQVEVDAPAMSIPAEVGPGRRIWMEAVERVRGGVMEARTELTACRPPRSPSWPAGSRTARPQRSGRS